MVQVTIIGSGNVAQHLIQAFSKSHEVELVQVVVRNTEAVSHLISKEKITNHFADLLPVDLFIIAVSDDAIQSVSSQIPFQNKLVAHSSGSVAMDDLDDKNRKAGFYPLQTFSKSKEVDFKTIPICIEATHAEDLKTLETVAKSISVNVYNINSEQRKALHVAAVFVNNFANHLYQIGNEICKENSLSFDLLKPLIQESANKIMTLSPKEAQTGPAKRKDTQTINSHLNFLTNENQKEIYKLLTKSIIDNDKKL
jgi:predicted short-subunit dehydrogenase-like oxidoreductase (DUF2520 family)